MRYEYSKEKSKEFFLECSQRLAALSEQINKTPEADQKTLTTLFTELNRLNALLARIERSHIGEFSWPFAESFEQLAIKVLTAKAPPDRKPPLFFISADGGLDIYRIFPEQVKGSFQSRQIFSINFPRSLKDHVLYHPILGHELGHAAWTLPELQRRLVDDVLKPLFEKSQFSTNQTAQNWIKTAFGVDLNPFDTGRVLKFWIEEYLSDIFGLLIFGPSFMAAHRSLLSTLDVTGTTFIPTHPPNVSRFWMLDVAYKHLAWDQPPDGASTELIHSIKEFNEEIRLNTPTIPAGFKVFDEVQIKLSADGMKRVLIDFGNTEYTQPNSTTLQAITDSFAKTTPALATSIDVGGNISNQILDFRHLLYCGWLFPHYTTTGTVNLDFFNINRMCSRSILQQVAIHTMQEGK
ncbi:MAG TPA: hypothetical protein VGH91_01820 [Gammaproteobacteria bacterium]